MSIKPNGSLRPTAFGHSSAQRQLAKSVLKDTAARMIRSVERSALAEKIDGVHRTHTAEDFLLAFKAALYDAAEHAGIKAGREREELLASLVSVCMEELYRPDSRVDGADTTGFGFDRASGDS
jgi:hypothetical protein